MSEEQIEIAVERMQDGLDKRFLRSDMTQAEYDRRCRAISRWAAIQRRRAILAD